MKIYQVYDSEDAIGSEKFFPTLKELKAHLRLEYSVKGAINFNEGAWESAYGEDDDCTIVHAFVHDIQPTAQGICFALANHPMR